MKTAEGRRADEGASRRQTLAPPVYRPKQEKSVRPQAGQPGLLQGRQNTVQPRPAQTHPKGRAVQPSMPAGAPVKSPAAAKPQGNVARHQPAAEQRRDAFSRVIQRRVRIQNIDYDPERSAFRHSDFDVTKIVREATASGFWETLNSTERTNLQSMGTADLTASDVPSLATAIIAHIQGSASRGATLTAVKNQLEHALGRAATVEVSTKEAGVFNTILDECTSRSRTKGGANQVNLAKLPDKTKTCLRSIVTKLTAQHNLLRNIRSYTRAFDGVASSGRASYGLDIVRSAHTNRAGWLPAVAVATPEAALDTAVRAFLTNLAANGTPTEKTDVAGEFPTIATVTAQEFEDSTVAAGIKRQYFNNVFAVKVTSADRVRLAWKRYVTDTSTSYIEFTAADAGGVSRVVWDFVNDRFYICVHYNWVLGYNPFFQVNGLSSTY